MRLRSARRSAISCGAYIVVPVTLVPGRSRLFTTPVPTGSKPPRITTGIDVVAFAAATVAATFAARIIVDLAVDEFLHHGVVLAVQHRLAVFDADVSAFDIAELCEALPENIEPFWIRVLGRDITQHRLRGRLANMEIARSARPKRPITRDDTFASRKMREC